MLESYCADIENLLREGLARDAFRVSLSLPDISAALEDPQLESSREQYVRWCDAWLTLAAPEKGKPIDGARLYRLYAGRARLSAEAQQVRTSEALARLRMSRRARGTRSLPRAPLAPPLNAIQALEMTLTEGLIQAARRWYRDQGAGAAIVQRNLGRLLISG